MPKKGDTVVVHYRGTLRDGKEFDSSEGHEPLQFIIGSGSVIPGFEKAVLGMKQGETKTVTIKASEAYGPPRRDLILEIRKEKLPAGMSPRIGDRLQVNSSGGRTTEVKVVKTGETSITVDGNHELAGQGLIFTLKLVAIAK